MTKNELRNIYSYCLNHSWAWLFVMWERQRMDLVCQPSWDAAEGPGRWRLGVSPRRAPHGHSLLRSLPAAHQNRVTAIIFSLATEWVISTGHDKCVSWMCTRSGNMLGQHFFTSWASCLQYPSMFPCPLLPSVVGFQVEHILFIETEWLIHIHLNSKHLHVFFGIKCFSMIMISWIAILFSEIQCNESLPI